jgi:single-stranded DNA-binding protein
VHQHLKKGAGVYAEGRLEADDSGNPRIWSGQDGAARASFEVTVDTVRFLPRSQPNGGNGEAGSENITEMVSGQDALEL